MNQIKKLKITQAVGLFSVILFFTVIFITPDYETMAFEKIANELSYEEYEIILEYYQNYENNINPIYYTIDSITTLLYIIWIISTIYSSILVFNLKYIEEEKQNE